MKQKIYSIFMLLSFLVILCHEMISHHHHDEVTEEFSTVHILEVRHCHSDDEKLSAEKTDLEQINIFISNNHHNHAFPMHQHVLAVFDNDFLRFDRKANTQWKSTAFQLLFLLNVTDDIQRLKENQIIQPPDNPHRTESVFLPGAIGLRAPPALV